MRKKLNLAELSLELPKIESNETRFLLGGSDYDTGVDNPLHELNIPPIDSTPNVEPVNQLDPADLVPYENELPSADLPDIEGTQGQDTDGGIGDVDTTGEGDDDNINDPDPNDNNDNNDNNNDRDNPDNTQEISEWGVADLFEHYNNGDGEALNLNEIGLRDDVKDSDTYLEMMRNVNDQIEQYVHDQIAQGSNYEGTFEFTWDFNNSYDFTLEDDLFAIGSATIEGNFVGEFTIDAEGKINVTGQLEIDFHDRFEDPWDLMNSVPGSWDPSGTPFDIDDNWQQEILMENIIP